MLRVGSGTGYLAGLQDSTLRYNFKPKAKSKIKQKVKIKMLMKGNNKLSNFLRDSKSFVPLTAGKNKGTRICNSA
jgi:predicted nucleotide-binding protein (sugar kinase/HSP70/actin superfamily)